MERLVVEDSKKQRGEGRVQFSKCSLSYDEVFQRAVMILHVVAFGMVAYT